MKKLVIISGLLFAFTGSSFASGYKLDEASVDNLFATANDVTLTAAVEAQDLSNAFGTSSVTADAKTVGGFLVRAFFCGGFALHRSYMGTGGKTLFWHYFCIPVVGGVTACVDFWWVVFKGEDAMNKFANNSKFMVWND
jgi:hypothetical protein